MPAIRINAPQIVVCGPFSHAEAGQTVTLLNVPPRGFVPAGAVSLLFTEALDGTVAAWGEEDGPAAFTDAWVDIGDDAETDAIGGVLC